MGGGCAALQEPGVFAAVDSQTSIYLRVQASVIVPTQFAAGQAQVRLAGASGDFRMGWSVRWTRLRFGLELGAGVMAIDWQPQTTPPSISLPSGHDTRGYGLGGVSARLSLGPVRIGSRIEVRMPLRETTYDWEYPDRTTAVARSRWAPGLALEVGFPLTHF